MEQKTKKMPERQCSGCNGHFPKKELLRVVRGVDGSVSLDFTGKKSGRGAYICHSAACLRKARKAKRLEQAFSCTIPDEVYDALEGELNAEG